MPAVLLAGAFGRRDPGEEAVLTALVRALPGWETIVTSRDPAGTESAHGCATVSGSSRVAMTRVAAGVDAVVLGGGALEPGAGLDERGATASLARASGLVTTARALGKPTALLGIGSGRLGSRRRRALARALVRRADLFVLRDGASAAVLTDAGAPPPFRVGADPAWALIEHPAPVPSARDRAPTTNGAGPASSSAAATNRVAANAPAPSAAANGRAPTGAPSGSDPSAVLLALDRDACDDSLAARLAAALGWLSSGGLTVRLQPWRGDAGGPDDTWLAGAVAARIPGAVEVLAPPDGLTGARCAFARSALVLALRRHAVIAAAASGVPSLAVDREPGIAELARRLGQPWIGAETAPAGIAAAIVAALDHPPASRSAIQGEIASAEEGFRLLRLLLSRGRSREANDLTGLPLEPAPGA